MIDFASYQSKWGEEFLKEQGKTPEEIEVFKKAKELYSKYIDAYKSDVFKDNTKSRFYFNTFSCCLTDDGEYVIFQSTPDAGFPPFYNYSFYNKKEFQEFVGNMQNILNEMID